MVGRQPPSLQGPVARRGGRLGGGREAVVSRTGKQNTPNPEKTARFRRYSEADLVTYCTAYLTVKADEAAMAMWDRGPEWAITEDASSGDLRSTQRRLAGLPPRPHPHSLWRL